MLMHNCVPAGKSEDSINQRSLTSKDFLSSSGLSEWIIQFHTHKYLMVFNKTTQQVATVTKPNR